jgi:hypothetical protein
MATPKKPSDLFCACKPAPPLLRRYTNNMPDKTASELLLLRYEDNQVIRALVQLVPFGAGGALDVLLVGTLDDIRRERSAAFFDELATEGALISATDIQSEDFLHKYFTTVKAALNTRRREKIVMFAKLLKSSTADDFVSDVDVYEDFLTILDELTFRELKALSILDEYSKLPKSDDHNDLQWTTTFWDDFEVRVGRELDLPSEEVPDFMNRIVRTGCYEMFTGGYMDYTGGKGKLTPTFRRLQSLLQKPTKQDS